MRLYIVALADFLHEHGFGLGSVAAIISPNCSQFAVAFGAISLCGGAMSGVSCLFLEGNSFLDVNILIVDDF
jgi:acyl-CoA synthetase (AMP-forming)/AMP-acid ligase II